MKKSLSSLALGVSLSLGNPYNSTISENVDLKKEEFGKILDNSKSNILDIKNSVYEKIQTETEKYNFSAEQIQSIDEIISNKEFQDKFYDILKKEKAYSIENIIFSIVLGFIYFYAYFSTIKRVKDEYMPIDVKSFSVFGATSGGMVLINGFIPGSLVYAESFILAFTAVGLNYYNKQKGNEYKKEENLAKLKEMFDLSPFPTSKYRNDGYPEIWNKKMEEETGYTHKEVIEYWEQHGEIMTLLYKGENLEKVKRYLQSLSDTGEGYDGVAFTMTTKSGLEKTFLWTTSPFEGGSLRFARVLTDIDEIKKKLAETEEKTYIQSRTDHKFPVLNTKALNEDFIKLATNKNRQEDPKKYTIVMLDLDNFKGVNDKYGHSIGDKVLTEFIDFIQANIRGNDRLYRLGGDEFALIIDTDHTEEIYYKLNELRRDFFENKIDTKDGCINVGSSWGLKTIDITEFYTDDEQDILKKFEKLKHEIDEYMYGVKYYRLIKDELVESGKIQDDWLDKNGIAEAYYHPVLGYDGVKIRNNYGEFYLSLEEIELIEARKKEIDDMRNLK